jgi:hypothetical protein
MAEEKEKDKAKSVNERDTTGPPKNVGSFISPRTKQRIYIFAKIGESEKAARDRVRNSHGLV